MWLQARTVEAPRAALFSLGFPVSLLSLCRLFRVWMSNLADWSGGMFGLAFTWHLCTSSSPPPRSSALPNITRRTIRYPSSSALPSYLQAQPRLHSHAPHRSRLPHKSSVGAICASHSLTASVDLTTASWSPKSLFCVRLPTRVDSFEHVSHPLPRLLAYSYSITRQDGLRCFQSRQRGSGSQR